MPPLVSCLMPTANRRAFVPAAIAVFLAQDYAERELLILDDGADPVGDLVPADERIRYLRVQPGLSLGEKRNRACQLARGEILLHWDDDDWYPPNRVSRQVQALALHGADVCGSSRLYFRDAAAGRAWEYSYRLEGKAWLAGSTLAYRRSAWERHPFQGIRVGEDAHFVWSQPQGRLVDLADPALCVAAIHPANTSPKRPAGRLWRPVELELVERLIGEVQRQAAPPVQLGGRGLALVAVASGIGDVVRATPLVRVLFRLGYTVDVLCAPDYPQAAELLAGAPEIARLVRYPDLPANRGRAPCPELAGISYDVACFTWWARPLAAQVQARRQLCFERNAWLREGDSRAVEELARQLGWQGDLPAPFVVPAGRDFSLPPGTVALHAGCKRGWPWKKWHGFVALAERLEHVVLIGTSEDEEVTGTYFGTRHAWPAHVHSYLDRLSLPETAALVQQCAALVCNDSGMQHVGAAVGTPTYTVYGITSPAREGIPAVHVHPLTAGLPCEPACRLQPWGRRDCEHHLECLKRLGPEDVLAQLQADGLALPLRGRPEATSAVHFPATRPAAAPAALPRAAAETLTVAARLQGGIGDVLLASALLEALFDELRHGEIDVYYHSPEAARFVFANARFVRAVYPLARFAADEARCDLSVRALQFPRCIVRDAARLERLCPGFVSRAREAAARYQAVRGLAERQPLLDGLWARMSVAEGRNALDNLGFLGGVEVTRRRELFLAPDPGAYALLEQRVGVGAYVTVHDGFDNSNGIAPGAATKCWPLEHWRALVQQVKERWPELRVVQLGARKSRHVPGVDVDLVDGTDLHQAAWVLKNARLHVDTDSGLAHLARALHTPAVVLFGPTDVAYYGHADNSNLAPRKCGGCWWSTPDWLAHCPRGLARPECMDSIAPEQVLEAVAERVAQRGSAPAAASRVECYGGERRPVERRRLERSCRALGLELPPITEHLHDRRTGLYLHASKQWEYLYAMSALDAAFGPGARKLRIADLGGGRGALAALLAHEGQSVESFDLDYRWDDGGDPAVERRYREWARASGFRARFGSLFNAPAPSDSFDAVTCISVVEHVPYKEYALREALRILRPGGLLVLTFDFANAPERFEDGLRREIFSPERLERTLQRLGIPCAVPRADEVEASARRMAADGVKGIPEGMTVAGVAIRKEG